MNCVLCLSKVSQRERERERERERKKERIERNQERRRESERSVRERLALTTSQIIIKQSSRSLCESHHIHNNHTHIHIHKSTAEGSRTVTKGFDSSNHRTRGKLKLPTNSTHRRKRGRETFGTLYTCPSVLSSSFPFRAKVYFSSVLFTSSMVLLVHPAKS